LFGLVVSDFREAWQRVSTISRSKLREHKHLPTSTKTTWTWREWLYNLPDVFFKHPEPFFKTQIQVMMVQAVSPLLHLDVTFVLFIKATLLYWEQQMNSVDEFRLLPRTPVSRALLTEQPAQFINPTRAPCFRTQMSDLPLYRKATHVY
jgi:hypothetical protein